MTKIVLFLIFPNIFNFFLKLFCGLIKLIIFVEIINMTPKEKAIELHSKILNITYDDRDIPGEPTWVSTKCALIAVDEIIKDKKMFNQISVEYWEDVKQEIEAL